MPGAGCFALTCNTALTLLNRFSINAIFISNIAEEYRVERYEIKMLHKTGKLCTEVKERKASYWRSSSVIIVILQLRPGLEGKCSVSLGEHNISPLDLYAEH